MLVSSWRSGNTNTSYPVEISKICSQASSPEPDRVSSCVIWETDREREWKREREKSK